MTDTFISQLAADIYRRFGNNTEGLCIIFPTRRALVFFREAFAKVCGEAVWSPEAFAIEDFVRQQQGGFYPESIQLIFELYDAYILSRKSLNPNFEEKLSSFFTWGEILIRDFDEVDKYLVDTTKLYANLKDLKEIDAYIGISEEFRETLKKFLQELHIDNFNAIQQNFLDLWEIMQPMYHTFRTRLRAKNWFYEGMAFRDMVETLQKGELQLPYQHFVFAGFNALSKAEEVFIEILLKKNRATVYWDAIKASEIHKNPVLQDVFSHITHYHQKWKKYDSIVFESQWGTIPQSITLVASPQVSGQASFVGEKVSQQTWEKEEDLRKTAIVLADENLLFPVLYALPHNVDSLNVTMGFPLRFTSIYHLLLSIMRLIRNMRKDTQQQPLLYYKNVREVLQNPFIDAAAPEVCARLLQTLKKENVVYVSIDYLHEKLIPPFLKQIFTLPADEKEMENYLSQLFDVLLGEAGRTQLKLETEYLYFCYKRFNQLTEMLRAVPPMDIKSYTHLFRDAIRGVRIPFEGEPLKGLQIMGMLETRALDFENLYIISVNEGNLPQINTSNTFIPEMLRPGYGLPAEEKKSNIMAYHFYRLLTRAKNVHILYASEGKGSGSSGEMSRYLLQLKVLLKSNLFPPITLNELKIAPTASHIEIPAIRVPNTPEIQAVLRQKYDTITNPEGRDMLSASALSTWIRCKLAFYLKYIAAIKIPSDFVEEIDEQLFGTLLHDTIQKVYMPLLRLLLTDEMLIQAKARVLPAIEEVFEVHGFEHTDIFGRNYLYKNLIIKLCEKIIDLDRKELASKPFVIQWIEKPEGYKTTFDFREMKLRLSGKFDRMDSIGQGSAHRVIDYKTGSVVISKNITMEKVFADEKNKNLLQGYLYAYLHQKNNPHTPVFVAFHAVKNSSQGLAYLEKEANPIAPTTLKLFEETLQQLMEDIFTLDFIQTEDEKDCKFCEFKMICNRKEGADF